MANRIETQNEIDKLPNRRPSQPNAFVYLDASGRIIIRVVDRVDLVTNEDHVDLVDDL